MMMDEKFQLERKIDQLEKTIDRNYRRQTSIFYNLWQGMLIGIGSTVGLVVVIYILIIVLRPLEFLPLVGNFLDRFITPTLERVIESKLPAKDLISPPETPTQPVETTNPDQASDQNTIEQANPPTSNQE